MTVSPPALDRFLADLSSRRERLESLAAAPGGDALARELAELGEQLVVADEELRVQAEELDDVRRRLDETALERELMRSSVAGVLTTRTGVLVSANVASLRLADQVAPRQLRRPLATWFVVDDRPVLRSMITALTLGSLREVRAALVLRRRDGTRVEVDVTAEPVGGGPEPLVRWTFGPQPRERGHLHLVPDGTTPAVDDLLADDLTGLALDLAERDTVSAVLAGVADAAVGLVPGAVETVLTLLRRGEAELSEATSESAAQLQAWELAVGQGPACDALAMGSGSTVTSPDLGRDPRWPAVAPASLEVGLRGVVSVCVALPGVSRTAVLSCYGDAGGLDADAQRVALLVAAHASVALARAVNEANLRAAVESRQGIGQAVGILVEREQVTPEAAFDRLVTASQHANLRLREVARRLVESAVAADTAG